MAAYSIYTDQELFVLLKQSDRVAFTEIYERYKGVLHVHAYKKLGDFEEAKDVIQELFAGLWSKRDDVPVTSNLSGYLYASVRNRVLNVIAHKKVTARYASAFSDFVDDNNYTTDLIVREKELASVIEREINALPPKMREAFLLSRRENLSYKEIAEKLGVSEHTVKNQIKSSLKVLRTKLGLVLYVAMFFKF